MKFTALRHKKTPEFASIETFDDGKTFQLYTHSFPDPRPEDLTIELLKGYYDQHHPIPKEDVNFDDLEIKRYDFFEEGTVGADIRNKLSPIKTLLAILSSDDSTFNEKQKEYRKKIINDLLIQCKETVIYLSELL